MPKKPMDEDRVRRREELERKRAARRASREASASAEGERPRAAAGSGRGALSPGAATRGDGAASSSITIGVGSSAGRSFLLDLPEVAVQVIFSHLPAADLGRLTMTCRTLNLMLPDARAPFLVSRLRRKNQRAGGSGKNDGHLLIDLCSDEAQANALVEQSLSGGGDTGRILPRGKYAKKGSNEFVSYARFLEEAVGGGYGTLSTGNRSDPILLPSHAQGRFASASPEHSLCRVGGDGKLSGAGGSGVASWGVGKRG